MQAEDDGETGVDDRFAQACQSGRMGLPGGSGQCSVSDEFPQLPAQRRLVSEEAGNHRLQEARRLQMREVEGMARLCREQCGKGQLRSPIAFPERMDRIQVGEERGGLLGESLRLPSPQEIGPTQPGEQRSHLTGNVFGKTERAPILGHPDGPVASRPAVHILEEMPMHRAVMRGGKAADRQRLFSPYGNAERLEGAELGLIAQAEPVLQHRRPGVAVPVRFGVVEIDAQAFFPNWRAIERRRSSLEAPARSRSSSIRFESDER